MFWCSVAFLALLAADIVLLIDVPRVDEAIVADAERDASLELHEALPLDTEYVRASERWGWRITGLLLLLWPVFVADLAVMFALRNRALPYGWAHRWDWVMCLFPPLRMCRRDREESNRIWFPGWGWRSVDYPLRRELEHAFSLPMIVVSLFILPVLILQYFFADLVERQSWLKIALHISAGLIWFCFAFEFIVMLSVAPSKWKYCKKHWLDLLIIVLPLISFLRSVQSLRGANMLRTTKLHQLGRVARVYRLRGLSMRIFRAILLFEVFSRILPSNPAKKLARLRLELEEREFELGELKKRIAELESQLPTS
jgi:voltage-gated potassium channel